MKGQRLPLTKLCTKVMWKNTKQAIWRYLP